MLQDLDLLLQDPQLRCEHAVPSLYNIRSKLASAGSSDVDGTAMSSQLPCFEKYRTVKQVMLLGSCA